MEAADPSLPEALPRVYASWRSRTLAGVLVATAVGLVVQGPMGEIRFELDGERPSPWLLLGLVGFASQFSSLRPLMDVWGAGWIWAP